MPKTLGQANYEGYCEASGNKSLISGQALPGWMDLKPEIQAAWNLAAKRVDQTIRASHGSPVQDEIDQQNAAASEKLKHAAGG